MLSGFGPGGRNTEAREGSAMSAAPYAPGHASYPATGPQYQNYPPPHNAGNPSYMSFNSMATKNEVDVTVDYGTSRTPSPTPSEVAALNRKGIIDWKAVSHWRYWIRREWLWYYVILSIILVVVILITVYDKQIVRWLQPTAEKIRDLPAGWVIPIAIFFIISFPPLFGHEILAILVGVVWGLWIGFAITAAGTFVGEVGNFYAFKYCCRARGEKLEKSKIQYACLARIVREGGFKIALVARYSAIPGHFTTAVFSTCGMGIWVFALAAFLSLPKQFITVYIGVILEENGEGTESTKNKIISDSVLAVTILVTGLAMWYLYNKMDKVKHDVIYERRKARQEKIGRAGPYTNASTNDSSLFNPRESESESHLPLNPGETSRYQQWNNSGTAVGISGDPSLYAPSPQRPASASNIGRIPTYRTEGGGGYSTTGERYGDPSIPGVHHRHTYDDNDNDPERGLPPPQRIMAQHRQESVDSVSWDMSNQGMGADAFRLPTIHPHTPLSGGFANSQGYENSSGNQNSHAPNVVYVVTTSSPTQTPRQPAFQHPPRPPPQRLHPPAVDPLSSAENLAPDYNGPSSTATSSRPGPEAARTPPPLQPPPSTRQTQVQPVHVASGPSSPYSSNPHSPVQYAIAYQPPSGPPPAASQPALPSPQFGIRSGATGPISSSNAGGVLPSPHDYYTSGPPVAMAHTQMASDSSAYYTAPHSRVGTEDELLPRPHSPSNHPVSSASQPPHPSSPHSPSIPYPPQRNFSPPPPSYHTTQS